MSAVLLCGTDQEGLQRSYSKVYSRRLGQGSLQVHDFLSSSAASLWSIWETGVDPSWRCPWGTRAYEGKPIYQQVSALLIQTHLPFLSGEHSSETAEKLSRLKCFNHIPVMLTDVTSPKPKVQLPQTLSLI